MPGNREKSTSGRKKKKMKFQMEGSLPLLPSAPADTYENTEVLQLMIREFMAIHYQLACGKPSTSTPWTSITKHQSRLWDSDMWPSGVIVKDPSKIVLGDCRDIVSLWRERQAQGGPSHVFRFKFYINSEGLQRAKSPGSTPPVEEEGIPTVSHIFPPQRAMVISPGISITQQNSSPTCPFQDRLTGHTTHTIEQGHPIEIETPSVPQWHPIECETPLVTREVTPPVIRPGRLGVVPDMPSDNRDQTVPTVRLTLGESGALPVERQVDSPEPVESDPPLRKGKERKRSKTPCTDEDTSDVSTESGGRKNQQKTNLALQKSLANMSLEPAHENEEPLPPRLEKKSRKKVRGKGKRKGKKAPSATRWSGDDPDSDREESAPQPIAAGGSRDNERGRIKPKPKPKKKETKIDIPRTDNETLEEQREREDNLFIVRKSARIHKPKYNFAPPAQLRLEKEREANKSKGNNQ